MLADAFDLTELAVPNLALPNLAVKVD